MIRSEFYSIEKLYHYTNINAALKILTTQKLRFSPLSNLNDVHEAYRTIFYKEDDIIAEAERVLSNYRQISFSMDSPNKQGFAITPMWGHYADKNKGVCFVFDKEKLLSKANERNIMHNKVKYVPIHTGDIDITKDMVPKFFKSKKRELFFKKSKDWAYEQEYRMLLDTTQTNQQENYLDINNSLIAIIAMCAEDVKPSTTIFDSILLQSIQDKFSNIPILELSSTFIGTSTGWNLRDTEGNEWYPCELSKCNLNI
ncbi:MAG: DUF2971 domain-containing protein [Paludibacteraceae bacterium]